MIRGVSLKQLLPEPAPSVAAFEQQIVPQRRPFVFTGLIDGWPARTRWSRQYFADTIGDAEVPVEITAPGLPKGYFHADREKGFFVRQMKVRDMIAAMAQ